MKDKDFLDMNKFYDDISVDVKKKYINIHFLTPYELKIKSDAIFEELPLFKNTFGPRSVNNWNDRLTEEIEIFNILKEKYKYSLGFAVFDNLEHVSNNRIWTVDFHPSKGSKTKKLEIRISIMYPKETPIVGKSVGDRHVSLLAKCFGKLRNRWRNDGKYGLAHFCTMIGYYYALENKSVRI